MNAAPGTVVRNATHDIIPADLGITPQQALDMYNWHDNENIFSTGPTGWEATFERLLILEDQFRSGYECDTCEWTGKLVCPDCDDGSSRLNPDMKCKSCNATRKIDCPDCKGKGMLLEIPDAAQRRPTTGTVLSIGEDVKTIKRGDTVVYSNFVGEVYDLTGIDSVGREKKIVIRVMKEREIICRIYGHMELKRVKRHQTQAGG